jgi:predicted CoA-binding protein
MPSAQEQFWTQRAYAFVGNSARKPFPRISYGEAKKRGKTVFPVDPSAAEVEGDRTFADLSSLPEKVDGVVIEVPAEETAGWVERAAAAGLKRVWIHDGCETPEALELGRQKGLEVLTGHCAVMYLAEGFSAHAVHRFFTKLSGRF